MCGFWGTWPLIWGNRHWSTQMWLLGHSSGALMCGVRGTWGTYLGFGALTSGSLGALVCGFRAHSQTKKSLNTILGPVDEFRKIMIVVKSNGNKWIIPGPVWGQTVMTSFLILKICQHCLQIIRYLINTHTQKFKNSQYNYRKIWLASLRILIKFWLCYHHPNYQIESNAYFILVYPTAVWLQCNRR